MSFFKKNKEKTKKVKAVEKPSPTEIERDIAKMDRERHLDMQIEKLTSQLNIKPESPQQTPTPKPDEKDAFLSKSLEDFAIPTFTASLSEKTKNIDVTTETPPAEPNIDEILAKARKDTKVASTPVVQAAKPIEAPRPQESFDAIQRLNSDALLSDTKRLDMGEMRLDVAKISADIQSGEELYRRALQRVEGLMGFVEKAEVDFSVLNRLEPENRRLKAKLRTANGEVENSKAKISLLTTDLEDHQERLADKTKQYEAARSKLTIAAKSLQEYERVLKKTKAEAERYILAIDRHKTTLSVESKENKILREKIGELSTALETRQAEYLEASKMVESLRSDCADFRDQADTYRAEVQDLRISLNAAKRQNNALKGEMQSLHEDIKTFKTQYEFNVINREDQVTDLESQIAFLSKEVDIKAEMAESAQEDVASLRAIRSEQDIERDRLEKQLAAAHDEIRDATSTLENRSAEQMKVLEDNIHELKAEIIRRDESAQHNHRETADLQRQYSLLEMELGKLQTRLDLKTAELELSIKNNPAATLEAKIENLTKQLVVKDDIVRSAAQDVANLRKEREDQIRRQKHLEDLVHTQTFQLEAAHKALLESKQTETELDQKYKDIAAALSVNQSRRRMEGRIENPDITPDISDEFQDLSGEDVEDRILDYKFGIRKDIV